MDTTLRQWTMLRVIPRYPKRIDAGKIKLELEKQGYGVTLRTIQRDLIKLSTIMPLCSDHKKPQGWWWDKEIVSLEIPSLDPQSALIFKMVEAHLKQLLPVTTLETLSPWFKTANSILDSQENGLAQWSNKIRVIPRGLQFLPPKVSLKVQEVIYQAIYENKRIAVSYLPRDTDAIKHYEINPLALIQKDKLIYIVCTVNDYIEPRLILLHRIQSASVCFDKNACCPDGFNIDDYIESGELSYRIGPDIVLVADFDSEVAIILFETPLSDNQILETQANGKVRLITTHSNTLELKAWLRSFGQQVQVIEPANFLDS